MEEEEEDSYDGEFLFKKKKLVSASGSGKKGSGPSCQAERCVADLSDAKRYLLRHSVCQVHVKASVVTVAGLCQSFCQQCSRFHELSEFDDTKRSCRERLAGHNKRRRKGLLESHAEGSGRRQINPGKLTIDAKLGQLFLGLPLANSYTSVEIFHSHHAYSLLSFQSISCALSSIVIREIFHCHHAYSILSFQRIDFQYRLRLMY